MRFPVALGLCVVIAAVGCRTTGKSASSGSTSARARSGPVVRGVMCLFDQKPWISADSAGDRDPEGIRYRVFLDSGSTKGVLHDGTFHIEMYKISRNEKGEQERTLVSDWHYSTSEFTRVRASVLGMGYLVQLQWAKKDLAGNEIELITQFEDTNGFIARGATRRLRIPKYTS